MKKRYLYLALLTLALIAVIFTYNKLKSKQILQEHLASGKPVLVRLFEGREDLSFRGIASINDTVVWVSGNFGTFGKSLDGGKHWVFGGIPGADSLQFRDIHLFDGETALAMGAGAPTAIFKTTNGGSTWHMVYHNPDTALFLDGFDFWPDGSGIAFGDPINNRFLILKTLDFGETWEADSINSPLAQVGEAGFAASGTSLVCAGDSTVYFVTGGSQSRLLYSANRGKSWEAFALPMAQGAETKGAFSIVVKQHIIVVGGDYANDSDTIGTVGMIDENENIEQGKGLPYQSAVQFVNDTLAISVGTAGCFVSRNGGKTWEQFSNDGMHTLVISKNGTQIYTAGPHGRIGKIAFKNM